MKNIHVLPTDKPSKIFFNHNKGFEKYQFSKEPFVNGLTNTSNQNIYITNDEEIKEDNWGLSKLNEVILFGRSYNEKFYKKIILTTDQDLIDDGVQSIDEEYLEWFVKNPSCEEVEVKIECTNCDDCNCQYHTSCLKPKYNIVKDMIRYPKEEPKQKCECTDECLGYLTKECKMIEEPKQETIEEVAEKYVDNFKYGIAHPRRVAKNAFINGAKWQQEQLCNSEIIQRIRATKSDAEARRIIKSI